VPGPRLHLRLQPAAAQVNGAAQLTSGDGHLCWVTLTGGVKCVGAGGFGQLGNAALLSSSTPVDVVGFAASGAAAVAAHASSTCALTTGGAVQCWGHNDSGQLGDGTTANRSSPVNVSGLTAGATAIAVGDDHSCALVGTGSAASIKCWGDNTYGQLGNGGSTTSSLVPVTVTNLGGAPIGVSAGSWTTCALLSSGAVKCWGYNGYGQVGNNDSGSYKVLTPAAVVNVSGATNLSSGYWHSCAKTSTGIWCWGWNSYGQCGNGVALGTGGSIDQYSAVQVIGQ
jgi:alpha-tubulin suppressor-like RCC1 family protein